MHLNAFCSDVAEQVKKFEQAYLEKHRQEPQKYPLDIPVGNEGLWLEFFLDYLSTGNV